MKTIRLLLLVSFVLTAFQTGAVEKIPQTKQHNLPSR